jgi:diaminopimelate decarboxylase
MSQQEPSGSQVEFSSLNNELIIGGLSLTHIENLLGRTPFYAYDKALICKKTTQLKSKLPKGISLHYAIKSNPYPSLVNLMAQQVDGFDVASKNEMLLALQSGMPATNISFAGPGKTQADLTSAIITGVTLHVESINELNFIQKLAQQLNLIAKVALRINPEFELKSSGMKMAGGSKPFGIDQELVPDILKKFPLENVNLRGFHIFAGSQNLNADAIISTQRQTFSLADELVRLCPKEVKLEYINIGGGFGVPYFKNENSLELTSISNNLTVLLEQHNTMLGKLDIIIELGRYLVAEAGVYVSKVIDKKVSRGTTYLVCDGGLHHHLANSGNFGQVIRKNYPVAIGNKYTGTIKDTRHNYHQEKVNIVGPLCTPLDKIADQITLPKAEIGDYVTVFQSGAYGASASPKDFLSQPSVGEILL